MTMEGRARLMYSISLRNLLEGSRFDGSAVPSLALSLNASCVASNAND